METFNFFNFKISVKSSDIFMSIKAYEVLAESCDYPLHLGITEAGSFVPGSIKSSIGIGNLLMDGIVFANRVLGFVNAPAFMQRAISNILFSSVDIFSDKPFSLIQPSLPPRLELSEIL